MKHKPFLLTFTGVDNLTNIDRMVELSKRYPIEWGLLFGNQPGHPRYISDSNQLWEIKHYARQDLLRLSFHLCGRYARSINASGVTTVPIDEATRVQINALEYNMPQVESFCRRYPTKKVICQHRVGPFPVPTGQSNQVLYLHDQSGGRGQVPVSRPTQINKSTTVGYAGGIRPDNVAQVISEIDAEFYWLDMESGVRDDADWLDLDKVEAVCRTVYG